MSEPLQRQGGSFAPPIDTAKLAEYRAVIAQCRDEQTKAAMTELATMVEEFNKTPASSLPGTPHLSGTGSIVPLEESEKQRMWDLVPWDYEISAIQNLFDRIPVNAVYRNAAFHLLWYAKELEKDREPITTARL